MNDIRTAFARQGLVRRLKLCLRLAIETIDGQPRQRVFGMSDADLILLSVQPLAATQVVDGAVLGRLHEPRAGGSRYAV